MSNDSADVGRDGANGRRHAAYRGLGPGLVQHDAGQIIFNADGSVGAIRGPNPQFEGQTFCFALLP